MQPSNYCRWCGLQYGAECGARKHSRSKRYVKGELLIYFYGPLTLGVPHFHIDCAHQSSILPAKEVLEHRKRENVPNMSTKAEAENVALVRKLVTEIQQNANFDLIDDCVSPDWVDRTPLPGQDGTRAGVHRIMRHLHSSLSDIKVDIEHCVCTGDVVATNKVMSGKQVGELFGQPATNKRVQLRIMDFIRAKDGMLVEHWACAGPVTPADDAS